METLFNEDSGRLKPLTLKDADVWFAPNFFQQKEANDFFNQLYTEIQWEQKKIKLFGKELNQPRLTSFYGDPHIVYTYSGLTWHPQPWTQALNSLKKRIEQATQLPFNCVLLNLYRNGNDSMGWHSDDEPELGEKPAIASISFGATRKFCFRHRIDKQQRLNLQLTHGSCLLMKGDTQRYWHHQLPKTKQVTQPRINLTFRLIEQPQGS